MHLIYYRNTYSLNTHIQCTQNTTKLLTMYTIGVDIICFFKIFRFEFFFLLKYLFFLFFANIYIIFFNLSKIRIEVLFLYFVNIIYNTIKCIYLL